MRYLRLYFRVLAQLRAEGALAWALVGANIAVAFAAFAEPLLLGRVVDRLAGAKPEWRAVAPLIVAWGGFGLFAILAGVVVALYSDRLAQRRRMAAMADFFAHLMDLPASFHAQTHSGRLTKIMLDGPNAMFGLWLTFFREHCAAFVALFVTLPATLAVNARFGLVLIGLVGFFGVAMNYVIRGTKRHQGAADGHYHGMAARVADALHNLPMLQAFARTRDEARAYRASAQDYLAAQFPVLAWWALATIATRASATLTLIGVLLFGVWLDINGRTSIGEIVAFMGLAGGLIGRLDQINGFLYRIFGAAADLTLYFDTMAVRPAVADRATARAVGRLSGEVAFDNVAVRYGERVALDGVSFQARAGQTIALVGATGSGKSTAMALLHRAFDPARGRVVIDGIDLRDMTLASLRANIGVVLQEPYLLARSVADNLRVGKPDATAAEMERALARAQADFVAALPQGLEAEVGERGRNLSGGERQRLSIARALVKDPPILILDEATSALDATTEARLQAALESARAGRTTFIIAHRLSTIRNADVILVFERGRIVEAGGFEQLVARNGAFAQLARAQNFAAPAIAG
ncbi:MAG: glucan ABC transporter ATP-binding protein/ permease [Pseudomonadota bacterium]|nr:glucan ABC transporter ATP-binding protein/ permease [Pseudomonadota bacterium]